MTGMRAPRRLAAALLCALVLAGCTQSPDEPEPAASEAGAGVDLTATEAGDLRLELEGQFGLQAHLLLELQRSRKAARDAAVVALEDSADELVDTVESAYDADTARRFRRRWAQYSTEVTQANDPKENTSVQQRRRLQAGDGLATLMAEITGDRMEADGTAALLRMATRQFLAHGEALAKADHEAVYASQREAFADMVTIGRAFAAGTSEHQPDRYPGPRSSGPLELRSALRQLVGEHTLLADTVLRRASLGAKDFSAAAAALNGNTEDLIVAFESVYAESTDEFGAAWRDRISGLADYTVAAVESPKTRKRHRRQVAETNAEIATLLAEASDDNIDADAVAQTLGEHTEALLAALDAYLGKDFETAGEQSLQAYGSGAELADSLAEGIVAHRPDEFPTR